MNIKAEERDCRRVLRCVKEDLVEVQRRAESHRPRGSRSRDDDGDETMGEESEEGKTAEQRRLRYMNSTQGEVSDPEEWANDRYDYDYEYSHLYSPSTRRTMSRRRRLRRSSRARSSRAQSPRPTDDAGHSEAESEDTMMPDYMADEYMERPKIDWRYSGNRAQLTAGRVVMNLVNRALRAAERGNGRVASWFKERAAEHRSFCEVGNLELQMPGDG